MNYISRAKPCLELRVAPGHDLIVMESVKVTAVAQIAAGHFPPAQERLAFSIVGIPHDILDRLERVGLEIEPIPGLGIPVSRVRVRDDAERVMVRMMYQR